jgi:PAS domain S-box-containing protein
MWHVTPFSIVLILAGLLTSSVGLYAWRHHASIGWAPMFVLLGSSIWSLGYGVALGVHDLAGRLFWAKVQHVGIATISVSFIIFTLNQAGYGRWLTWRKLLLLALTPGLGLLLAWTNEHHHLIWADAQLVIHGDLALLKLRYGPYFWLYTAYNYLVMVFGLLVFWRLYRRSVGLQRRQTAVVLLGILCPMTTNFLYLTGLDPIPDLDLTPLGYGLASLVITWGLLRFRLFDIAPIARNQVLQDMPDAVLVLDSRGRLEDLNPAAARLLGLPEAQALGRPLAQLAPGRAELLARYREALDIQDQIVLGTPERPAYYSLRITPLYDWRQRLTGRVVVLHDVTERQQREVALSAAYARLESEMTARAAAQQQVLEQQRALAALDERERLGHALHDGLGQIMAYLNLEAQTAQALLEGGNLPAVRTRLAQITQVVREAHDDVRGFILGLSAAGQRQSLPAALQALLERFSQRSGAAAHLEYPENAPDPAFIPSVEETALSIVREALKNAHKHAAARQVTISFSFSGALAQIAIVDDGVGFDLSPLAPPAGLDGAALSLSPLYRGAEVSAERFGLRNMQGLAEQAGGRFELRSALGQGTQVRVQLPCLAVQAETAEVEDLRAARGLRLLLVDDHPLFLDGLRNLLCARGLTVVGQARDGLEAQQLAQELRPDVVVMDVNMPGCDGLEATRAIKAALPETQVLILTVSEEEDCLYEAIKSGAAGYLLKSLEANEFVHLLAGLSRGETPLPPGIALRLLHELGRPAGSAIPAKTLERPPALSERQWLILQRVAEGHKYKEIAAQLSLSERTVKREMGQVLAALHLESRRAAIGYARRAQ